MTRITTEREVKGYMPKKIYMARIGGVAVVRCLYEFAGEIPDRFVEAWHGTH